MTPAVDCGLQPVPPIGLSPLYRRPSLEPSPSAGGAAHWPLTPIAPSLPLPGLPSPPPFPSGRCANGAPGLSLFHCPVSGPRGGGPRPSPVAGGVQVDTPALALEGGTPQARTGAPPPPEGGGNTTVKVSTPATVTWRSETDSPLRTLWDLTGSLILLPSGAHPNPQSGPWLPTV